MEIKNISKRFKLFYLLTLILSSVISKCLYFSSSVFSSDIYFTGSKNAIIRKLPDICNYSSIIIKALFIGAAVAFIIYAVKYFGKRTAIGILIYTLICYTAGEIIGLIYNIVWNNPSVHSLFAALFAFLSDFLFFILILTVSIIIANRFLILSFESRRRDRLKKYSEYKACLFPCLTYLLIKILDLTFFNVIPFLTEYDNIQPNELKSIIYDYTYFIAIAFVLPYIFSLIFTFINKKLTGALMPKYNGGKKTK